MFFITSFSTADDDDMWDPSHLADCIAAASAAVAPCHMAVAGLLRHEDDDAASAGELACRHPSNCLLSLCVSFLQGNAHIISLTIYWVLHCLPAESRYR